jgi:hypothetical protein
MIANTEFESDGSGTNSPGPEKKRKRGLGKGGAAAKYCTMSVAARMAQFPDEPFEERLDLLNQPMMWCLACGKPVAHQTKSFVASHLIDEVMQKRPSGTLIRLSFVTDHTTCLMKCLNFAQGEGPSACYMYDKLMDVVHDWKDTLQQAKLSPRIEGSLKVLKNGSS